LAESPEGQQRTCAVILAALQPSVEEPMIITTSFSGHPMSYGHISAMLTSSAPAI